MSTWTQIGRVLSRRQFVLLWTSQAMTELAYQVVTFSLVIAIYQMTGMAKYVSALVVATSLAPILFSSLAGTFADSYDRRKVMLIAHAARAVALLCAVLVLPWPIALIVVVFLFASIAQFFEPAQAASIPALVAKEDLFVGNSFFSFTRYAMFLIGYMIAGPLIARLEIQIVLLMTLTVYVVASIAVWMLQPLRDHLPEMVRKAKDVFIEGLKDVPRKFKHGFVFLWKDKITRMLVIQVAAIFAIEKSIVSLLPVFAFEWLQISLDDVSLYIILPTGIGTLLGTVVANALQRRVHRTTLVTIGTFLDGVCLLALALYLPISSAVVGSVDPRLFTVLYLGILACFSGAADPMIIIPTQTILQERTVSEHRGRIFGNFVLFMNVFALVPVLGIGVLADVFPAQYIVGVLAAIIIGFGVVCGLFWRSQKAVTGDTAQPA